VHSYRLDFAGSGVNFNGFLIPDEFWGEKPEKCGFWTGIPIFF